MDLFNQLKAGSRVFVNGTLYEVGKDGVCRGVNDVDAEKLLQNASWTMFDPSKKPEKAARPSGGIKLVDSSGTVHEKPEVPEVDAEPDSEDEPEEAESEDEGGEDPPIPDDGGDWPDPDESMSLEYLQAMADAYEVSYSKRLGKPKLIDRIKEVMFE